MELKYARAFPCAQAKIKKHNSTPPKIVCREKKDTSVSFKLYISDSPRLLVSGWDHYPLVQSEASTRTLSGKHPQQQRIRAALAGCKFKSAVEVSNRHGRVTPNKHHTEAKAAGAPQTMEQAHPISYSNEHHNYLLCEEYSALKP